MITVWSALRAQLDRIARRHRVAICIGTNKRLAVDNTGPVTQDDHCPIVVDTGARS